jgi:hypothetical protein|nr:MAG TPA: hypothetical protein [Caudoviricetes sp.]DAZ78444.1 MAG TPA: hypothetical protein [Caudoviricetes sp.]
MYNYTPYGVGMSPYQQQLTQNRMEQLQGQYNNMYNQNVMQGQQQQNIQMLKGRPVSSYDEAKAAMIDLDGSMFVFTDIANKRIYTKQIMLDGSAELKVYTLQEQNIKEQKQNTDYVLQSDFEQAIEILKNQILELKGVKEDEQKL